MKLLMNDQLMRKLQMNDSEQVGVLALYRLYERISYLITPTASVGPPDTERPTRLACIAMAVHEYERATNRPLTPNWSGWLFSLIEREPFPSVYYTEYYKDVSTAATKALKENKFYYCKCAYCGYENPPVLKPTPLRPPLFDSEYINHESGIPFWGWFSILTIGFIIILFSIIGLTTVHAGDIPIPKNTIEVDNKAYTAYVDKTLLVPILVVYQLTENHSLGCLSRTLCIFHVDKNIKPHQSSSDYDNSGYDLGHQAPFEDFAWNKQAAIESCSMDNIAPQKPGLNRQEWERLEETVRSWTIKHGPLTIYTGPIFKGNFGTTLGKDKVGIPTSFYKIIVGKDGVIAFIMPQKDIPKGSLNKWQVSVKEIEDITDLTFPIKYDKNKIMLLWSDDLVKWRREHKFQCEAVLN
jgi:endonuclease G